MPERRKSSRRPSHAQPDRPCALDQYEMAAQAIGTCLAEAEVTLQDVTILCTGSSGGDLAMPGFANMVQGELHAPEIIERSPERDHHQVALVPKQLHERMGALVWRRDRATQRVCDLFGHLLAIARERIAQPPPIDAVHQMQDAPALHRLGNERIMHGS